MSMHTTGKAAVTENTYDYIPASSHGAETANPIHISPIITTCNQVYIVAKGITIFVCEHTAINTCSTEENKQIFYKFLLLLYIYHRTENI